MNHDRKIFIQTILFRTFIKVIKQHGLYWPCIKEMNRLVGQNIDADNLNQYVVSTSNSIFTAFEQHLSRLVNEHYSQMRHNDTEYDYLICCVNTCIHVLIEDAMHHDRDNFRGITVPRFEELGGAIFNKAAKVVFGPDFKDEQNNNNGMIDLRTLTKEEQAHIQNLLHNNQNQFRNPQEMMNFIMDEVAMLRNQHNEEEYYDEEIDDFDTDDDFAGIFENL